MLHFRHDRRFERREIRPLGIDLYLPCYCLSYWVQAWRYNCLLLTLASCLRSKLVPYRCGSRFKDRLLSRWSKLTDGRLCSIASNCFPFCAPSLQQDLQQDLSCVWQRSQHKYWWASFQEDRFSTWRLSKNDDYSFCAFGWIGKILHWNRFWLSDDWGLWTQRIFWSYLCNESWRQIDRLSWRSI